MAVHTTANPILREIRDNGNQAVLRRPITKSVHPVVTVHPVTGKKALFVNSSYTQSIVGFDDDESGESQMICLEKRRVLMGVNQTLFSNSCTTTLTGAMIFAAGSATSRAQWFCGTSVYVKIILPREHLLKHSR